MYIDGKLNDGSYKRNIENTNNLIENLELKLSTFNEKTSNFDYLLENSMGLLSNIDNIWQNVDVHTKNYMMCSIFPEKLIFEGKIYRTLSDEGLIPLLSNNNKGFKKKKRNKSAKKTDQSLMVTAKGLEPPTLRAEI